MAYPLRDKDPERIRLITIRTAESRLLMIPNRHVRRLIGSIIARYQEIFSIEIFALVFLSNHMHMLARSPLGNMDEFLENVDREVARRLNWFNNRQGPFWSRRYDDLKVMSDEDMLEAFLYITTNAVKHGLVEHPSLWPGLNSYNQCLTEKGELYVFHHYSAKPGEPQTTEHTLKISPLPTYSDLPDKKRKKLISQLINERAALLVKERRKSGQGFIGVIALRNQDPMSKPQSTSRGQRPPCYTKNSALRKEYRVQLALMRTRYTEASERYRLGDFLIEFPCYTFKPPNHRKPRSCSFKCLPDDYFKKAA